MPTYQIKVKDQDFGHIHTLTVWASSRREANINALIMARKLLKTDRVELAYK